MPSSLRIAIFAVLLAGCRADAPSVTATLGISTPSPISSAAPTITGEVPGPDATPPPTTLVLSNLTVDQLAARLFKTGLTCESTMGGYPGQEGGYTLFCSGVANGYELGVRSPYWAGDVIEEVHVDARPTAGEPDPAFLMSLFKDVASLPLDEADAVSARVWLELFWDDPTCRTDVCEESFGDVTLVLQGGPDEPSGLIVKSARPDSQRSGER